jgi:hypothetical protein
MKPIGTFGTERLAEQKRREWLFEIDPKLNPVEDVFRPQYWVNASALNRGDLIHIRATDGSYDFTLVVDGKTIGGRLAVKVSLWPKIPGYVLEAEQTACMEMVPVVTAGAKVPRVDYTDESHKWRVIGFRNEVVSIGHESEVAAQVAMAEYVRLFGLKTIVDRPPVEMRTGEPAKSPPVADPRPGLPPELNVSFQRRKEIEGKAKREAQKAADLEQLAKRKADAAAKADHA